MREFVVSCGYAPEVLDPAKHAFNGVSITVKRGRKARFPSPIALRWDIWSSAHFLDLPAYSIAVIALIAMQDDSLRHLVEQRVGGSTIRDLPAGQEERDWPAQWIGKRVDLGGPATARAAYRLIALPPLPPEAQRCAFTAELSIKT